MKIKIGSALNNFKKLYANGGPGDTLYLDNKVEAARRQTFYNDSNRLASVTKGNLKYVIDNEDKAPDVRFLDNTGKMDALTSISAPGFLDKNYKETSNPNIRELDYNSVYPNIHKSSRGNYPIHETIAPNQTIDFSSSGTTSGRERLPIYKFPTQPIAYRPKATIAKSTMGVETRPIYAEGVMDNESSNKPIWMPDGTKKGPNDFKSKEAWQKASGQKFALGGGMDTTGFDYMGLASSALSTIPGLVDSASQGKAGAVANIVTDLGSTALGFAIPGAGLALGAGKMIGGLADKLGEGTNNESLNITGDVISNTLDPLKNVGSAVDRFSKGDVGKGFLDLLPIIGPTINQASDRKEANKIQKQQDLFKSNQPMYDVNKGAYDTQMDYMNGKSFAKGGNKPNIWTLEYDNPPMAYGGQMTTEYNTGGTHEQNPNGGIPIGNSLVEEGEIRFDYLENKEPKSYIFSNRLKYKKNGK